jgi:hypothetical protein
MAQITNGFQLLDQNGNPISTSGGVPTTVSNVNPNGQATMGNSSPVVIASDQSAIPVTGAGGTQYTDGGTPPANPIGNALVFDDGGTWKDVGEDDPFPVNLYVQDTVASVNAGNRDAGTQRIIEAGNPTPTVTQVASANSDTSLLAANTNKKGTLFFNDSTAILYLLYGTGVASTTNYSVQIQPKGYFEDPMHYTGGFHGIWSAANGFVYCTEVS